VNNANLLGVSNSDVLKEASDIIAEVSSRSTIPIGFISGLENVLRSYDGDESVERLYLEKFIKLPWEQ